jgi:ketosteroid isomerase-like protein
MNRRNIITAAACAAAWAIPGIRGASAQPAARQLPRSPEPDAADLLRAERSRADAIMRKDVKSLRFLLGSNYYHVESNGRVRSKTEFLQAIDRGEFALVGFRVEESEIDVFGDFAIVRGVQVIERGPAVPRRRYKVRYLRVWQRVGAQWVNTVHQSTEVKGSASA